MSISQQAQFASQGRAEQCCLGNSKHYLGPGDFYNRPDVYAKEHEKRMIFLRPPSGSSGGLQLLEIPNATGVTGIASSWTGS